MALTWIRFSLAGFFSGWGSAVEAPYSIRRPCGIDRSLRAGSARSRRRPSGGSPALLSRSPDDSKGQAQKKTKKKTKTKK